MKGVNSAFGRSKDILLLNKGIHICSITYNIGTPTYLRAYRYFSFILECKVTDLCVGVVMTDAF